MPIARRAPLVASHIAKIAAAITARWISLYAVTVLGFDAPAESAPACRLVDAKRLDQKVDGCS